MNKTSAYLQGPCCNFDITIFYVALFLPWSTEIYRNGEQYCCHVWISDFLEEYTADVFCLCIYIFNICL